MTRANATIHIPNDDMEMIDAARRGHHRDTRYWAP